MVMNTLGKSTLCRENGFARVINVTISSAGGSEDSHH